MIFDFHSLQTIAFSAMLPMGIVALGLILNTLLGLMTARIRWDKPFDLATHSKISLVFIILLLGALMGILFQDSLYLNFLLMLDGLTFFVGPLLLLMAALAFINWLSGRKLSAGFGLAALAGCASAVSLVLFVSVGGGINAWKNASVRSYVAHAVPVLDEIKAHEGAYPSTLPISSLGEPPSLLQKFGKYSSDGTGFRFEYVDEPAGWAGGRDFYVFDSSNRQWTSDDQ